MANVRFSSLNYCSLFATVIGHSSNEDSSFPFENLISADRYSYNKTTGSGEWYVWLDLGASRSVKVVGVRGYKVVSGSPVSLSIEVGYSTAAPASVGSFTNIQTLSIAGLTATADSLDRFKELAAAQSARYWQFRIPTAALIRMGGLWLAAAPDDLGIGYSSAETVTRRNRSMTEMLAGEVAVSDYGRNYSMFRLGFESITGTELAKLKALAARSVSSFVYLDPDDANGYECVLANDGLKFTHRFTGLYDASLDLRQLA